jgi:hypothetical protein
MKPAFEREVTRKKPYFEIDEPPKKRRDKIVVLRVNPFNRTIARMVIEMSTVPAAGAAEVMRLCRANSIGSHPLDISVDDLELMAAGGTQLDPETVGWMLEHQLEDTAGIGLIFAKGPGGGMVSLPARCTVEWAMSLMIWTPGRGADAPAGPIVGERAA